MSFKRLPEGIPAALTNTSHDHFWPLGIILFSHERIQANILYTGPVLLHDTNYRFCRTDRDCILTAFASAHPLVVGTIAYL